METRFAIQDIITGKLVGFCVNAESDDFCVDVSYEFDINQENIWTSTSYETALKASTENPPSYNAGYSTPMIPSSMKLKVVKISINISPDPHQIY